MPEGETTECPFCRETILAGARKCKHCGSMLAEDQPTHGGTCPFCKEAVHPEAVKCKHCGSSIGPTSRGQAGPSAGGGGCGCGCGETPSMPPSLLAARLGGAGLGGFGGFGGRGDFGFGGEFEFWGTFCRALCNTAYGACLLGCGALSGPAAPACFLGCSLAYELCVDGC